MQCKFLQLEVLLVALSVQKYCRRLDLSLQQASKILDQKFPNDLANQQLK